MNRVLDDAMCRMGEMLIRTTATLRGESIRISKLDFLLELLSFCPASSPSNRNRVGSENLRYISFEALLRCILVVGTFHSWLHWSWWFNNVGCVGETQVKRACANENPLKFIIFERDQNFWGGEKQIGNIFCWIVWHLRWWWWERASKLLGTSQWNESPA